MMFALHRAASAALLLSLSWGTASGEPGHWIKDPKTHCALNVTLRSGDTVNWIGECRNGRGEGPGTASFFNHGQEYESFTGTFAGGVAEDGHVIVRWGNGWSYDGGMAAGRFNGQGVFIRADGSRLEGEFEDGKFVGPIEAPAPPVLPVSLDRLKTAGPDQPESFWAKQ
jgi:hypothetical protein